MRSLTAVLNLWVAAPIEGRMTLTQGSPKFIRKHGYLHDDSRQKQNHGYEVAKKKIYGWGSAQRERLDKRGHGIREIGND